MKETKNVRRQKWGRSSKQVFSMAMLGAVFLAIFSYLPMFGVVLAFKDGDNKLNMMDAIFRSDWVGLKNFKDFFTDSQFMPVLVNTLGYNLLSLVISFPITIIFALLLNEIKNNKLKRGIEFFVHLPYFISMVVFVGIIHSMLDVRTGVLNDLLMSLGMISSPINFKGDPAYSWGLMIISNLVKGVGWGTIIYLAAIAGTDESLYEAAELDGANRLQRAVHITLPAISNLIILNLILSISGILNNGAADMLLWQTQSNLAKTEVIDTFVMKNGISNMLYSYTSAVGLFKSVLSFILIFLSNKLSRKITGEGVIY